MIYVPICLNTLVKMSIQQPISRYCCSYYFGEWNTCWERGLPPFLLSHLTTSGYPYHWRWLLNLDGHCHYPNLHRYGATNIDNNNTWNGDGRSKNAQSYAMRTPSDDFTPLVIEIYGCFHFRFDSFLTTCAYTIIVCHQWSFLIPMVFISYF